MSAESPLSRRRVAAGGLAEEVWQRVLSNISTRERIAMLSCVSHGMYAAVSSGVSTLNLRALATAPASGLSTTTSRWRCDEFMVRDGGMYEYELRINPPLPGHSIDRIVGRARPRNRRTCTMRRLDNASSRFVTSVEASEPGPDGAVGGGIPDDWMQRILEDEEMQRQLVERALVRRERRDYQRTPTRGFEVADLQFVLRQREWQLRQRHRALDPFSDDVAAAAAALDREAEGAAAEAMAIDDSISDLRISLAIDELRASFAAAAAGDESGAGEGGAEAEAEDAAAAAEQQPRAAVHATEHAAEGGGAEAAVVEEDPQALEDGVWGPPQWEFGVDGGEWSSSDDADAAEEDDELMPWSVRIEGVRLRFPRSGAANVWIWTEFVESDPHVFDARAGSFSGVVSNDGTALLDGFGRLTSATDHVFDDGGLLINEERFPMCPRFRMVRLGDVPASNAGGATFDHPPLEGAASTEDAGISMAIDELRASLAISADTAADPGRDAQRWDAIYESAVDRFDRLETLVVPCTLGGAALMRSIERLPRLTSLDLSGCHGLREETCAQSDLEGGIMQWKLASLSLRGCVWVSTAMLEQIAHRCPTLTSLDLAQCEKVYAQGLAEVAKHCTQLVALDISYCKAAFIHGGAIELLDSAAELCGDEVDAGALRAERAARGSVQGQKWIVAACGTRGSLPHLRSLKMTAAPFYDDEEWQHLARCERGTSSWRRLETLAWVTHTHATRSTSHHLPHLGQGGGFAPPPEGADFGGPVRTEYGDAFSACEALTSLDFSGSLHRFDARCLTSILRRCGQLRVLDMTNSFGIERSLTPIDVAVALGAVVHGTYAHRSNRAGERAQKAYCLRTHDPPPSLLLLSN